MIVEIRTYRIKPGLRDRFLAFFENHSGPLQQKFGMRIVGPLVHLEDPDVFVWLRTFSSLQERDRMTRELYEGAEWNDELRAIALPMLDSLHRRADGDGPRVHQRPPRGPAAAARGPNPA